MYSDATAQRLAEVQLTPIVVPLKEEVVGGVATLLWLLFGGMTFVVSRRAKQLDVRLARIT